MRILHIAATLGRGGIATSLWHLLPSLAELPGNEVNGAIFYEKGWFGELLEAEGIKLQHLHMGHKYDPWVIFKLVRLQKDYDVVHAHGWPIIFFVALASLFANRPVYALTEHSVTNRRRRPVFRWLDRFIYSRFDQIVAVSQAVAESLADWQPQTRDKITVIYNSIQMAYLRTVEEKNTIRQRLNLDEQTPVIFASGNFRMAKGFDLLLQSMVTLLDKYRRRSPDNEMLPVLVITGEGELQNAIVELAMKLGIRDQVRFLGFRTDMPHILKAADLFVLSSRWEGCPMVVLESMALGIPILATNVGGVPELVEDNQNGKLIPPDNLTALANGMYELLRDRKQAECLADEGQQRLVQKFKIEANAQRMTTMYRQAMGHLI